MLEALQKRGFLLQAPVLTMLLFYTPPVQAIPGLMAGRWQQWLPLLLAINALLLCQYTAVSTTADAVQCNT
jgi:hypothetical protein